MGIGTESADELSVESERLLSVYLETSKVILDTDDFDDILDRLTRVIVEGGIFRGLMIALVDESSKTVHVMRENTASTETREHSDPGNSTCSYDLNDVNVIAEVARSGKMEMIEGWDDRFDPNLVNPENLNDRISYFIPVMKGNQVLAVLAIGSRIAEKNETLRRIEVLGPLFVQVAIALETARLLKATQELEGGQPRSQERIRDLYDFAPDLSCSVNVKNAMVIECNETLASELGYSREEILDMQIFDLYTQDSGAYYRTKVFPELVKTGVMNGKELQLRRKDGSVLDVS